MLCGRRLALPILVGSDRSGGQHAQHQQLLPRIAMPWRSSTAIRLVSSAANGCESGRAWRNAITPYAQAVMANTTPATRSNTYNGLPPPRSFMIQGIIAAGPAARVSRRRLAATHRGARVHAAPGRHLKILGPVGVVAILIHARAARRKQDRIPRRRTPPAPGDGIAEPLDPHARQIGVAPLDQLEDTIPDAAVAGRAGTTALRSRRPGRRTTSPCRPRRRGSNSGDRPPAARPGRPPAWWPVCR